MYIKHFKDVRLPLNCYLSIINSQLFLLDPKWLRLNKVFVYKNINFPPTRLVILLTQIFKVMDHTFLSL